MDSELCNVFDTPNLEDDEERRHLLSLDEFQTSPSLAPSKKTKKKRRIETSPQREQRFKTQSSVVSASKTLRLEDLPTPEIVTHTPKIVTHTPEIVTHTPEIETPSPQIPRFSRYRNGSSSTNSWNTLMQPTMKAAIGTSSSSAVMTASKNLRLPSCTPETVTRNTPTTSSIKIPTYKFRKPKPSTNSHSLTASSTASQQAPSSHLQQQQQQQQQQQEQRQQQHVDIPLKDIPPWDKKKGMRLYLATYSKADMVRFPTRESFANFITSAFNARYTDRGANKYRVEQWATALEPHQEEGCFHYHVALKLSGPKKWWPAWKAMYVNGVCVGFSDKHDYYASMYRYVTKTDENTLHSAGHKRLEQIVSPRTKSCNISNRSRRAQAKREAETSKGPQQTEKQQQKQQKEKDRMKRNQKLQPGDVASCIVKNNIHTITELYVFAKERYEEGECDLWNFTFSRSEKLLLETIKKSWDMENCIQVLSARSKTRLQRLDDAIKFSSCPSPNCQWLERALEVLRLNGIERSDFARIFANALRYGRRKFNNVMIVGRTNSAKSWIMKPLKSIYQEYTFENPLMDKFGWLTIEDKQVIILNDFRYQSELIPWGTFLLFLEGETVTFPTPKNHTAENIVITSDNNIPIFANARGRIEFKRYSEHFEAETNMMNSRWKIIEFTHQFPEKDIIEIPPCARCFCDLIYG